MRHAPLFRAGRGRFEYRHPSPYLTRIGAFGTFILPPSTLAARRLSLGGQCPPPKDFPVEPRVWTRPAVNTWLVACRRRRCRPSVRSSATRQVSRSTRSSVKVNTLQCQGQLVQCQSQHAPVSRSTRSSVKVNTLQCEGQHAPVSRSTRSSVKVNTLQCQG